MASNPTRPGPGDLHRRTAAVLTATLCLAAPPVSALHAEPSPSHSVADSVVVCVAESRDPGTERTRTVGEDEALRLLENTPAYRGPCASYGPDVSFGGGPFRVFVQRDTTGIPLAMGVSFEAGAFGSLPTPPHDGNRCLDLNGDRRIELGDECVGGHERVLFLPRSPDDEEDGLPFRWVLLNWNPGGHGPPGVWTHPHFDFHFFIQSLSDRNRIRMGRCAMLVDCDDLAAGTTPVPPRYLPPGYEDRGVVEFGMGNHLLDPGSDEFHGAPFTHSFIYGAWNGSVSFYEPMIALAWLSALRDARDPGDCHAVPQPAAWAVGGYYPLSYCIRYRPGRDDFTVSLEDFVLRKGS